MSTARLDDDFWTDPKIKNLSPDDKLLFIWLFTNPYRSYCGLYYLPKPMIGKQTGLSNTSIDRGINTLIDTGLICYDEVLEIVFIKNMLKRQIGKSAALSDQQSKGIIKHLDTLHNCLLIQSFLEIYNHLNIPYSYTPIDTPIDSLNDTKSQSQSQSHYKSQSKSKSTCASPAACESKNSNGFDSFWNAYPKKKSKGTALKAWNKVRVNKDFPGIEHILAAINRQKTEIDWLKDNGQYIPYPATWLNSNGWDNEPVKLDNISQRTATNLRNAWEFANE